MLKVGIDKIAFYTSQYALDLASLAAARGIEPDKFYIGLGQRKMAVPPPSEDVVTLAANAAFAALENIDVSTIEMLLFATESGIDQSKAAGIYVHDLLQLPERCRVVELKQACYSATFALQLAVPFLRQNPEKKILLIASDIARYGLSTPGESSQGCGAIAMVLSVNPRVIAFGPEYGVVTENVMDFWRPNYTDAAFVEGKYSSRLYLNMLEKTWEQYHVLSKRTFLDHAFFCYHCPVPRLVEKAHYHLARIAHGETLSLDTLENQIKYSLDYGRHIGNSYTASLYVGLASLLDTAPQDLAGERIAFYSYGSGCVAEFFSGQVVIDYQNQLNTLQHRKILTGRTLLSYAEYEKFYNFSFPQDGSHCELPPARTGKFRLSAVRDHKRIYERTA